jgi:hypothetical protein
MPIRLFNIAKRNLTAIVVRDTSKSSSVVSMKSHENHISSHVIDGDMIKTGFYKQISCDTNKNVRFQLVSSTVAKRFLMTKKSLELACFWQI